MIRGIAVVTTEAEGLVQRFREMPTIEYPWPHAVLDDFFPADVFQELLAALPEKKRSRDIPESVRQICLDPAMLTAIAERHGFPYSEKVSLEIAYTGPCGLNPHTDRADKEWSGQVYLKGDPKGTELFNAAGEMVHTIEWKPNRLSCWTMPPKKEKHAGPKSEGRYLLLYWIMKATLA